MRQSRLFTLALLVMASLSLVKPALASPDFLVDATWLEEHIGDENLIILEVRFLPHRYHTVGHIPGAIQVQRLKDLGDNAARPPMRFPDHTTFQHRLRQWGINDDSTILIYDDARTVMAARLYFMLALYGFNTEQVKILDGGTLEFSAFNDLETEPQQNPIGTVTLQSAHPEMLVEWTEIYDNVVSRRDEQFVLIDARPEAQYTGEQRTHSLQAGHIPGAINIVSMAGTDGETQTWLDDDTLEKLYQHVPEDKTVYVYCDDGFRMSLAWLQLKHLGFDDVRLYNGGWAHWGNDYAFPVITGSAPNEE